MSTTLLRDVVNGWTGRREDVLISQGRVVQLGDLDRHDADHVLSVKDAMVLPGLRDAHVHSAQWATLRQRLDVRAVSSADEAAAAVAARAAVLPGEEVLVGYGFRDGLWGDVPHKSLLDRAAPGRPVMLLSNDLHAAWLSSAALHALGRPEHETGLLLEHEAAHAAAALGSVPADVLDRWVLDAVSGAARRGVTALVDFEIGDNVTDWVRRRRIDGRLDVRVTGAVYPDHLEQASRLGLRTGQPVPGSTREVIVGPYKLFLDGSLNTRTALCHEAYPDTVGPSRSHGLELLTPTALREQMRRAWAHGLQPAVHAIGDRACAQAIDAFEAVGCPGRIEHAQLLASDDVRRLAALDVTVGVQPAHCPDDRDVADAAWRGRTSRAFVLADMVQAGVRLEFGSDAPVAPLDPWDGIASATSRTDDDRPPWHPEQVISLRAAVQASCGGHDSLRVGDDADLVLLPTDLPHRRGHELREVEVLGTMIGGRWSHRVA